MSCSSLCASNFATARADAQARATPRRLPFGSNAFGCSFAGAEHNGRRGGTTSQPDRRHSAAAAAAASEWEPGSEEAARNLVRAIAAEAQALLQQGERQEALLKLKQGLQQMSSEHPGRAIAALLHTQMWQLLLEQGEAQYAEALLQAEVAFDLVLAQHNNPDCSPVQLQGIPLGISLAVGGLDLAHALKLLLEGRAATQHILNTALEQAKGAGERSDAGPARSVMAQLAQCDFYIAVALLRKALQSGKPPDVPLAVLKTKWLAAAEVMAEAKGTSHPMLSTALRELGRLTLEAEEQPEVQAELRGVVQQMVDMVTDGYARYQGEAA